LKEEQKYLSKQPKERERTEPATKALRKRLTKQAERRNQNKMQKGRKEQFEMGQQHQQKKKIAPFRESKCAWK
jgi:hypothetical protein